MAKKVSKINCTFVIHFSGGHVSDLSIIIMSYSVKGKICVKSVTRFGPAVQNF